jgi:hypothetical protein
VDADLRTFCKIVIGLKHADPKVTHPTQASIIASPACLTRLSSAVWLSARNCQQPVIESKETIMQISRILANVATPKGNQVIAILPNGRYAVGNLSDASDIPENEQFEDFKIALYKMVRRGTQRLIIA